MNIANLEKYVEGKNAWTKMFGHKELSLLNAKDRQCIANSIDADLSPENLTCDGEATPSYVRLRQAYLFRCAEELISIDPSVSFYEMGV